MSETGLLLTCACSAELIGEAQDFLGRNQLLASVITHLMGDPHRMGRPRLDQNLHSGVVFVDDLSDAGHSVTLLYNK